MNPFDESFDETIPSEEKPAHDQTSPEPDLITQLNDEGVLYEYQVWLEELALARGNGRAIDYDIDYDR